MSPIWPNVGWGGCDMQSRSTVLAKRPNILVCCLYYLFFAIVSLSSHAWCKRPCFCQVQVQMPLTISSARHPSRYTSWDACPASNQPVTSKDSLLDWLNDLVDRLNNIFFKGEYYYADNEESIQGLTDELKCQPTHPFNLCCLKQGIFDLREFYDGGGLCIAWWMYQMYVIILRFFTDRLNAIDSNFQF